MNNSFRGDSQDISQVNTHTVGGTEVTGQVYTITINRKEISYTADVGPDDNDAIAEALQELLTASTLAEFREVTWTVSGSVITGTAQTAGKPFVSTSSATGTGTLVAATATASKGHWHWDDADNWSAGTVPAAAEDVYIENVTSDIRYGLDNNTLALTSLNIAASFTGRIGLPEINENGYREYRDLALKVRPGILNIGYGVGAGSSLLRINHGTAAAVTANVLATASPIDANYKSLLLTGSHAGNVLNATQGSIGIAMFAGEAAQFPAISLGSEEQPSVDIDVYIGSGTTAITALIQNGGNVATEAGVTTWTKFAGQSTTLGAAAVGTIVQEGQSTHFWQSNGTIGSGTFRGAGSILDASRDVRAKTLTASSFTGGAHIIDNAKKITFTGAIAFDAASLLATAQKSGLGAGNFSLQRS